MAPLRSNITAVTTKARKKRKATRNLNGSVDETWEWLRQVGREWKLGEIYRSHLLKGKDQLEDTKNAS